MKALYFAVNIFTTLWGQEEFLFHTLCPIHNARDQKKVILEKFNELIKSLENTSE